MELYLVKESISKDGIFAEWRYPYKVVDGLPLTLKPSLAVRHDAWFLTDLRVPDAHIRLWVLAHFASVALRQVRGQHVVTCDRNEMGEIG